MSILCAQDEIVIISHEKYLKETYLEANEEKVGQLFEVVTPFRMDAEAEAVAKRLEEGGETPKKKKRKKNDNEGFTFCDEVEYLKIKYKQFVDHLKDAYFPGSPSLQQIRMNNKPLRQHVKDVMHNVDQSFEHKKDILMNIDQSVDHLSQDYLQPIGSECHVCDIKDIQVRLGGRRKFDVVLLDPPWENKHVKRTKLSSTGYSMLQNSQVQNIPVSDLLSDDGLVLIWCSNNSRHRRDLATWLNSWNLVQLAKWYWLKVTKYGELICQFSIHKNPYEVIIVAGRKGVEHDVKDDIVIVSVPSGVHSHKPPMDAVINGCCHKSGGNRLEIFARYLQPNWVSLGNEACKLNHKLLFT